VKFAFIHAEKAKLPAARPGPVNVRETADLCIYCSDPTLSTRVSAAGLLVGYDS
jgi:hypothetical protein